MQSIRDLLPKSEYLTEAFKSDFIRNICTQMEQFRKINLKNEKNSKYAGPTFKELFVVGDGYRGSNMHIEWDKITDDDIQFFEPEEFKLNKALVQKLVKENDHNYIIFIFDNRNRSQVSYVLSGITGQAWDISNGREQRGYSYKFTAADAVRLCENSKIAIVYIGNSRKNVIDLQSKRKELQQGIVKNGDPEYNKQVALENLRRYQKIINNKKAKSIDKNIVDRISAICKEIVKASTKIELSNHDHTLLISKLFRLQRDLLYKLEYYIDTKHEILKDIDWRDSITTKNRVEGYEKDINNMIEEIKITLKEELGINVNV
jgi:hypothetical protein